MTNNEWQEIVRKDIHRHTSIGCKISNLDENLQHEVCEVICLKCLRRWIAVYPTETLLKNLECQCGQVGYVIKTGQTIFDEVE